jgi:hypothetical protein
LYKFADICYLSPPINFVCPISKYIGGAAEIKSRGFENKIIFVLTFHIMKHVTLLTSSNTLASAIRVAAMFALVMIGEYDTKIEV